MDDAPSGAELRARFRGSSDLLAQVRLSHIFKYKLDLSLN